LNSFRAAKKAVDSEIIRQKEILERGEKVIQETRGWNGQKTVSQKEKEEAADYRYFPEPDLPAFSIDPAWIEEIRQEIPELPSEKRERLKREYQLSKAESETLIRHPFLANFFEKAESELKNWAKVEKIPKTQYSNLLSLLVNYLLSDFQGELEKHSSEKVLVTPENFAELVTLVFQKSFLLP